MTKVKQDERQALTANGVLVAVRAAYRLGILDSLLLRANQQGAHPAVRRKLESERALRLEELREAGISEVAFEGRETA